MNGDGGWIETVEEAATKLVTSLEARGVCAVVGGTGEAQATVVPGAGAQPGLVAGLEEGGVDGDLGALG